MMPLIGSQAKTFGTEKDGVFEYSQKLSQQVLTLEADNVELQDAKKVLDAENQLLKGKVQELQLQCEKLRDTSIYTHQDKEATILQAREAIQSKHAEVMLARKSTEDVKNQVEALATDNMRLNGIAEKLQHERSELQRKVHGLEASVKSFEAELHQRALSEGNSLKARNALEQRLEDMSLQNRRLADMASFYRSDLVQLTQLREELLRERQQSAARLEDLEASRRDVAWLRARVADLDQRHSEMFSEVEQWRHAEGAAMAKHPRLEEAMKRESALADSLRGRIAELEEEHAKVLKTQAVLQADNATLRSQLASSRSEVEMLANANSRLAGEKSEVEHMASMVHAEKQEAHRRCSVLEREHLPKLMAKHQASSSDVAGLRNRVAQLEGENTRLKGQLSHAEVLIRGLKTQCSELSLRRSAQHGAQHGAHDVHNVHNVHNLHSVHSVHANVHVPELQASPSSFTASSRPSDSSLASPVPVAHPGYQSQPVPPIPMMQMHQR